MNQQLKNDGWTVLRFWDFEIKKHLSDCADKIENIYNEKKSSKRRYKMLKSIDLFAGIGGFRRRIENGVCQRMGRIRSRNI